MTELEIIEGVFRRLKHQRLNLTDEKKLQAEIDVILSYQFGDGLQREKYLDSHNIIDFFIHGVGIEVKIKGGKRDIYKQCERYCGFEEITSLILVTNVGMGFPEQINNKNCYVLKLSAAWL